MMVRSKQLQLETGYIDARPLTTRSTNLLQRTAGPYIWVKTGKAQCEHIFSALPLRADIAEQSRHVRFVPTAVIRSPRRNWRATRATPLSEDPRSTASHSIVR